MPISVFLSHNKADKPFVKKLARDLDNHRIRCWLDEAELKVGDSLIEKIRDGLDEVDYIAAILSPNSVASPWVQREIDVAMNKEIYGNKVKVLPIMYRTCELPGFLLGKVYADFTNDLHYEKAFEKLVNSMGVVFNKKAIECSRTDHTLADSLDKAIAINLPIFRKPFHRPFQYIGLNIDDAAEQVEQKPNQVGDIVVNSAECHMLLEAEGNYVSYVQVEVKRTAPHQQDQEFDSVPILGAFSINPAELDLVRKQTHYHTYFDHRKKLRIGVACLADGEPLTVSFCSKYYGM